MKYFTFASTTALLVSSALAATVPSAPWSTLTPTGKIPADATTDYSGSFGIQIETFEAVATESIKDKRAVVNTLSDGQPNVITTSTYSTAAPVAQITDGQIQHQTTAAAPIKQISDGQIQKQTTAAPVKQISDGQIQKQTTAAPVKQISDGQIQKQTTAAPIQQISDGQIQHQTAASVINQIGDGQIQHQTAASVINQIGDGQIQHQTAASVINQIGDGQIQHQTASAIKQISDGQIQHQTTASAAKQIGDGQIQKPTNGTTTAAAAAAATTLADGQPQSNGTTPITPPIEGIATSCSSENNLIVTLHKGLLTDSHGRVGAIVANRQFQFDGPPPQAGSIYAAGWSISKDGYLTLGDSDKFYQCKSGDFYNLYDQNVAAQCSGVKLKIINFVTC
ncbi:uncharacterized protein LODBEIA_P36340 [Lodderomyces beijingensis]|uniref:Cell wall mannoprotein PIR1-like C-terminal domain-containing protein n=1 Tax=Lodderomyces beijingensis TaxID=1775926 RepID=A0ABP0ZQD4_9ASCO